MGEKDHGRNVVGLGLWLELRLGLVLALRLEPGFRVRVSDSCCSAAWYSDTQPPVNVYN